MDTEKKFIVSSSPHLRSEENTSSIMLDVIIALIPALIAAVYLFGLRSLLIVIVSVAACIFFEWAYRRLMKKSNSIGDLSAAVTGILLALCLPVTVPLWIPVVGAFFAIVIVKQLYGGLGQNFMNPALAARAFLFSWPVIMSTWMVPLSYSSIFDFTLADAVTSATPLASLHSGAIPSVGLLQLFIGNTGGCIGEVSVIALLIGGIYLLIRKVISIHIPLSYILTVAVLTFIFPKGNDRLLWCAYNLCSGGIILSAFFMATDYVTSPITPKGKIIFGVGCGALVVFIRYFGSYPEGVTYAILLMNACVWLIDKFTHPKRFGETKEAAK